MPFNAHMGIGQVLIPLLVATKINPSSHTKCLLSLSESKGSVPVGCSWGGGRDVGRDRNREVGGASKTS